MTKLEKLLAELCPDKVEYSLFSDVAEYIRGVTYGKGDELKTNIENGIAVLRANNITLGANTINFDEVKYISPSVKIKPTQYLHKNDILICAGSGSKDHIGKVAFIPEDLPCVFGGFMAVIRPSGNKILSKYLFHQLTSTRFRTHIGFTIDSSTINNLNAKIIANFQIPVPPLEVQAEIVRILDEYSESVTTLQKELTAELTARKKQYEYYRSALFYFDDDTPIKTIPEFALTYIGLVTTMTKHYVPNGVSLIHNSCVKENRFEFTKQVFLDVPFAEKNASRRHKLDDVITVHTGDVGTSAVIDQSLVGSLGFATIVSRIHDKTMVLPRYLCYFLNSSVCKKQIKAMIKGDRDNLNLKDFNRIRVPLPPIEEQKRIILILERFDKLCNDISEGLPAEIEARRKQYEYYRDKLLSFEEEKFND